MDPGPEPISRPRDRRLVRDTDAHAIDATAAINMTMAVNCASRTPP